MSDFPVVTRGGRKFYVAPCPDCGETRYVRTDRSPLSKCLSCVQKGKSHRNSGRTCLNESCNRELAPQNKSGFCTPCQRDNVDGIKTKMFQEYNQTFEGKRVVWRNRGANVTDQDFAEFEKQTTCQWCGTDFESRKKCLDHDHKTGEYRGALCHTCNTALGQLGDDLDLIEQRLKKYKNV